MFSCYQKDTSKHPNIGLLRQHCTSEKYNSPEYTEEMYLEDMKAGYCRFWASQQKG